MIFVIKKVPQERKFLVQHALIYTAASWIASHTLEEELEMPKIEQKTSRKEQYIEMKRYIYSLFTFFLTVKEENKNLMDLAEKIAAHCGL